MRIYEKEYTSNILTFSRMKKILCLLVMYSFISFAHTVDGDILVQGDTHDYSEAYTDDYADPYASEVNDQFGGL